jgi:predicted PurR-regulated permease PerM
VSASRPSKKAAPAKRSAPSKRAKGSNGGRRAPRRSTVDASPGPRSAGAANGQAEGRAAAGPRRDDEEIPRWVRKAIALFFGWVVALVVAYWLVTRLRPILLVLLAALFVSLAMEPPVDALSRRGWSRSGATALVGGAFLVVTIGFFAAFGSVLFTQASQLVNNAPHYARNIVKFINDDFGTHINANSLIHDLQSKNGAVQKFGRNLAKDAPNVALDIGRSLLEIIVAFIFAFYLTADGPKVRRAICSRLAPKRQQVVLDTWELASAKTGMYLYSRALQAVACTAVVWLFLFLLGIPSSLALAIWVGVVSQFVPTVGTYIALVLPALVTVVHSPVDTIWVIAFLVGYQQFENYYLGPRIARFTLKIHPAVTIGSVFAGALLLGPVGALLALPAAAVIQVLITTHTPTQDVIETPLTVEHPTRRRRRRRLLQVLRRRRREEEEQPSPADAKTDVPGGTRRPEAKRRPGR